MTFCMENNFANFEKAQNSAMMGEKQTITFLNVGGVWLIQAELVRSKFSLLFLEIDAKLKNVAH